MRTRPKGIRAGGQALPTQGPGSPALTPALRSALAELRNDPVAFTHVALGVRPWSRQAEVLRALRDSARVAVAGGHGVGKGFTAACAVLWFLCSRPRSIVITTAPTERQVRRLLWGEIHIRHRSAPIPLGGVLRPLGLELAPDWYALGFCAVGSDQFQGFHADELLVVVDEAAGVPDEIYQGVDAILTGSNSRLLLIGNPTRPRGPFHDAFLSPDYRALRIPALVHPNVAGGAAAIPAGPSKAWIEYVRRTYGESSSFYRSRVLAEFPTEDLDALVLQAWIDAAAARRRGAPGPRALGVDVARFGSDSSVIAAVAGGRVVALSSLKGRDLVVTAEASAFEAKRHTASRIVVDDTGLGGGVTDMLRRRGLQIEAVNFAAAARRKERFVNVKAELYWNLRELLRLEAVALGDVATTHDGQVLLEQLALLTSEYDAAGRMIVRGSPGALAAPSTSPDHACAVALALSGLDPRALDLEDGDFEGAAGIHFL